MGICVKRKFYSKQEAKNFMRVANRKFRDEAPLTQAYQCLDCTFWHVTHKDKKESREKKNKGLMKCSDASEELQKLRDKFKGNSN